MLKEGLETKPVFGLVEKVMEGALEDGEKITLDGKSQGKAGMMLYTSGTTNRPVSTPFRAYD